MYTSDTENKFTFSLILNVKELGQVREKYTTTGVGSSDVDMAILLTTEELCESSVVPVFQNSLPRWATHLTAFCGRLWIWAGLHFTDLKGKQCEPITIGAVCTSLPKMFLLWTYLGIPLFVAEEKIGSIYLIFSFML